ncbi:hypothetical protein CYMTET_9671 [Cymbomonas tetramitiformis]|uniref:Glucose-induced degradation protein 4 homolog n=1 Tax=Cymbomonas tetramitiformis TaxID=36881 RepID=A0AAE0GR24_9CHLO|nr:hypothetical protein CYMTET_9671 [Cymbomonas tetramitiformis]
MKSESDDRLTDWRNIFDNGKAFSLRSLRDGATSGIKSLYTGSSVTQEPQLYSGLPFNGMSDRLAGLEVPCSFLSVGQAFEGTQNVPQHSNTGCKEEAWKVHVRIQGCDLDQGYICGSMEALNVPSAKSSVVTFWEGEIVDNKNYNFFTSQHWGADRSTDLKHWSKFACFAPMKDAVTKDDMQNVDLVNCPYIFMRWKEKCFVNVGPDCGLTIAGFYYICFSRNDGSVDGFYYDPNSSPFQKLELRASCEGRFGHGFPSYSFR